MSRNSIRECIQCGIDMSSENEVPYCGMCNEPDLDLPNEEKEELNFERND